MQYRDFGNSGIKVSTLGFGAMRLPEEEIRGKYQEIPWRRIAGMRDRLIHGYFTVDFERVWETIKRDLPLLNETITKISKVT